MEPPVASSCASSLNVSSAGETALIMPLVGRLRNLISQPQSTVLDHEPVPSVNAYFMTALHLAGCNHFHPPIQLPPCNPHRVDTVCATIRRRPSFLHGTGHLSQSLRSTPACAALTQSTRTMATWRAKEFALSTVRMLNPCSRCEMKRFIVALQC